jgi:hypothetical protein
MLVGQSAEVSVFRLLRSWTRQGLVHEGCGAANRVAIAGVPAPPLAALAMPHEGRGLPISMPGRLLEPGADLGRALRLLPLERPALEKALNRLGHVQPAARFVR